MNAKELKNALMNYNHLKRWGDDYKSEVDKIIYEMEGVKGIRYDNEMSNSTENHDTKMLRLIEQKDKMIVEVKHYQNHVYEVSKFIDWLEEPYKQIVVDKHFNDLSDRKLELKYHYSSVGIWKIINRMIERYIKSNC